MAYVMSCSQLNELWHYDFWLASVLMDLPLRRCTAPASELPDFPPMDLIEFTKLKAQVRAMWITASHMLTCRRGIYGWGLFLSEEYGQQGRLVWLTIHVRSNLFIIEHAPILFFLLWQAFD